MPSEEKTRIERIEEMLYEAQSVSSDAGSVTNRSIKDAIALDEYLTKTEAAKSPRMGLRIGKFIGPGHY